MTINPTEEILFKDTDDEIIIKWYWLIYRGKDPEGFRKPADIPEHKWEPEYSSWREATDEEMRLIFNGFKKGEFIKLKEHPGEFQYKEYLLNKQVSVLYKFPKLNLIVKKWRANIEEL